MLEGTYTSPKIRRLAVVLSIPWPQAIGLAGLLWRFTAKHAPTGEIGRHDDEDIATALEWPGDSSELVAAFVRSRLLDPAPNPVRLLVHDWPEHAPRYVRATLHRSGRDFSKIYSSGETWRKVENEATTVPTVVPTVVTTTDPTIVSTTVPTTYTSSYTSASTYSSSNTRTSRKAEIKKEWTDAIWAAWVPERKSGKKVAVAAIERSIRDLAKDEGIELKEAASVIAHQTRDDAAGYMKKIEAGETELQYVPHGSTYFKQERWNDGNESEPTTDEIRNARIADEIKQARADMDGELDATSEPLEGMVADS